MSVLYSSTNLDVISRVKFSRRKSFELYKKVIDLRKKEFSYTEIRRETGLAKSTIQNWLTHARLTLSRKHFEIQSRKRVENYFIATLASKATRQRRRDLEIQSFIGKTKTYFNQPFFTMELRYMNLRGVNLLNVSLPTLTLEL